MTWPVPSPDVQRGWEGHPVAGQGPCEAPDRAYRSPLLELPRAVAATGADEGVALHYGDPAGEQRAAVRGVGLLDGSHWRILEVAGDDRLSWLDELMSQRLHDLPPYRCRQALVLSSAGSVVHHAYVTELGGRTWIATAPGPAGPLCEFLTATRPVGRGIEVRDASDEWALLALVGPDVGRVLAHFGVPKPTEMLSVLSLSGGGWLWWMPFPGLDAAYVTVPRALLTRVAAQLVSLGVRPMGIWAYEALRVEARWARLGKETDDHTYPQEVGWMDVAVSFDKGGYRGRAAVARMQQAGRAPRRLVLLRLAGPVVRVPAQGSPLLLAGRRVGFVGTVAPHHSRGPLALALLAREVPDDADLSADGVPASVLPAPKLVPA